MREDLEITLSFTIYNAKGVTEERRVEAQRLVFLLDTYSQSIAHKQKF